MTIERLFLGGEYLRIFPLTGNTRSDLAVRLTGSDGEISSAYPLPVTYGDTGAIDAFGRLRVSEPYTLFDSQMQYNALPLYWETVTATGGTATHLPNQAAVQMRVDGTDAASVIRQTKQYFRYQPGKSQQILMTFVLGAAAADVRKRVGYFDTSNGLFLQQTATGLAFVRRSFVSSTAEDTEVAQSAWNIDPMDGSGPSGVTLDVTKAQILIIDLEWLGVGRARMGFVVDGMIYYAHEFLNANSLTTVYMSTANLPLRYEITRTATGEGNTDLYQICASVASEGGLQERFLSFSASNGVTLRTVSTTPVPVLAIRVATVLPSGGSLANHETVIPVQASVFSEDAPCYYEVLYNPTIADGSWTGIDTTHSGVEVNKTATSFSGGLVIDSGYVASSVQARSIAFADLQTSLVMTLNVAGDAGDTLAIVCTRVGTTNTDIGCTIAFKELY